MYVYCVYTAMPCIYKILKCTHKKAKTCDILLEFPFGCLRRDPCFTIAHHSTQCIYV